MSQSLDSAKKAVTESSQWDPAKIIGWVINADDTTLILDGSQESFERSFAILKRLSFGLASKLWDKMNFFRLAPIL